MLIIEDLFSVIPELIITSGALLLLLLSSYFKTFKTKTVCYLSILLLLGAICCIYCLYGNNLNLFSFSGTLIIDNFAVNAKFIVLIGISSILTMMLSASEIHKGRCIFSEIPILTLLSTAGMCLILSSNNLLVLYVGLELMSIPLYVMAACDRTTALSQEAGLKYFILGALASCIYLYGASIVYGFSSSLDFTVIGSYYIGADGEDNIYKEIPTGFLLGMILILISICFKISAAPFHMWTPDVYQGAPTIITALLASTPKIAVLGILLRLLYGPFLTLIDQLQTIIIFIAVISIFIGNFGAIMQHNLKRLLAYSAIGHVGFMLMGISSGDLSGIQNAIFYAIIYLIMTVGIFALLLMLKNEDNYKTEIRQLGGLAKSSPFIAASITILVLSMAGIPPFAGFFAKFYILYSIIQEEMYAFAIAGVIATVIGSYYYLRLIKVMYFDHSHHSNDINIPLGLKLLAGCGVMINLLYVLFPGPILAFAKKTAGSLIGY